MNHLYNLKYDQMRNNAPDSDGGSDSIVNHTAPSADRKLCLINLDRSRLSLNYNFMVWSEFHADQNTITLGFTSHTITLIGLGMEKVYEALEQHVPQRIICKDARYNTLVETGKPVINKIDIISKT